jgi:geranylgeranyl pyrophosphate synthase
MYDVKNLSKMKNLEAYAPGAMKAFVAFDKAALAEGAIPERYKELMALAVALTGQPQALKAILNRYATHLEGCRDLIIADIKKTPGTAVLAGYFQGGKMFRALLAFVAASAIGIEPSKMIPVASALELLHGASLIHDDIVDEAAERRSLPALHVQAGIGPALILGDYLILRAFTVLRESHHVYGPERVSEAAHILNHYAQLCCLGELHELMPTDEGNPEDEYLTIVQGKTASQFAAAVTVPAIVGGGTSGEIEALRRYGLNVGIAFQIQDDVLDIVEDTGLLGKPVGTCLVKERLLLPLIYLERYGSPTALRQYRRIPQAGAGRPVQLAALLKEEGILDRIQGTQDRYLSAALQALECPHPSDERVNLSVLATYAVNHHT